MEDRRYRGDGAHPLAIDVPTLNVHRATPQCGLRIARIPARTPTVYRKHALLWSAGTFGDESRHRRAHLSNQGCNEPL
jgi:hypothetical protein